MKFIIEAEDLEQLDFANDCIVDYATTENAKRTGVSSITIYVRRATKQRVCNISRYKTGTIRVVTYYEEKEL